MLASTEELHGKIERMGERIRILEEALGSLHREHAACPTSPPSYPETHPLLQGDLLLIKGQMDLYGLELGQTQNTDIERPGSREPTSDPCGSGSAIGRISSPSTSEAESPAETKRKYMMDVDEKDVDGNNPDEKRRFLRSLIRFPKDETMRLYRVAVRNSGWLCVNSYTSIVLI